MSYWRERDWLSSGTGGALHVPEMPPLARSSQRPRWLFISALYHRALDRVILVKLVFLVGTGNWPHSQTV